MYKVIPFLAAVDNKQGAEAASSQLEELINKFSGEGWEYLRMETVETFVAGSSGCFGLGAQPGVMTSYSMIVFKK